MRNKILAVILLLGLIPPGIAMAGGWHQTPYAHTRLVAAVNGIAAGADTVQLGWQVQLQPGWKTYWRAPGEAGLPPRFDWTGSDNLKDAVVRWPVPQRLSLYGYDTAVYAGQVVLPIMARLAEPGRPARLRLTVDYMVCADVCIPLQASYSLDLPAKISVSASPQAALLATYIQRVPKITDPAAARIRFEPAHSRLVVDLQPDVGDGVEDIFVAGPDSLAFARAVPQANGQRYHIPVRGADAAKTLASATLDLVLARGGQGLLWRGLATVAPCSDTPVQQC